MQREPDRQFATWILSIGWIITRPLVIFHTVTSILLLPAFANSLFQLSCADSDKVFKFSAITV